MEKVRYMISDAANLVHVEAHVLRYWEEELQLDVPRNELGHRYYTRENIAEFQKIKELKEQGYQLKAIRMILHSGDQGLEPLADTPKTFFLEPDNWTRDGGGAPAVVPDHVQQPEAENAIPAYVQQSATEFAVPGHMRQPTPAGAHLSQSHEERMQQFREMMDEIVGHAISRNNEELSLTIGREVGEQILKEINYLAREQVEASEERYRKLDAAIRGNVRQKKAGFSKNSTKAVDRKLQKEQAKRERAQKKMERKKGKKAALQATT